MNTPSTTENEYFTTKPIESITSLDWNRVSYVGAFIFSADGKILCIDQPHRGIDIPGGHRDPGECPQETLDRESFEEI
jgi:8-oxo-dGTP pyrophosphatase MutT (NUDIX family)